MAGVKTTQLHPPTATGRRYGSFAGRTAGATHPVGRLTQLHPQMATGRRYGSFADRAAGEIPPEVVEEDIWWRRARKARAGTYMLGELADMKREKRKLFKRFSRPSGT